MPFASPSQGPVTTTAGAGAGSRPTWAPATATQKICTCITINAGQHTADAGSSQAAAPVDTPVQSSAPSYAAPAAYSSGSQQSYASQSAPAQAGGDNRGPAMAAYPSAATPSQTNGGY